MRFILRSLLAAFASVYAAQRLVGGFDFGGDGLQVMLLVVLAIALLHMFMIPIFRILGLPHYGMSFLFLNFVLTLIILYVLTMFVPDFKFTETFIPQLRIFGFVLPSNHLSEVWSTVYSALVVSVIYHFFEWLCDKR